MNFNILEENNENKKYIDLQNVEMKIENNQNNYIDIVN